MGGIGIVILCMAFKEKNHRIVPSSVAFLVISGIFLIPGWDYFYTSGYWQVPTPPPPQPTAAQIKEREREHSQLATWEKEKQEAEREANSPERLKQLESEKKWVGSCCDNAGVEMRQYLQALGLAQDVAVNTIEYDVTKDDIVGVKIYLRYNSVESQANRDFQDKLKQKLELIMMSKLLVQYKRSQVLVGFDENKGNWDK